MKSVLIGTTVGSLPWLSPLLVGLALGGCAVGVYMKWREVKGTLKVLEAMSDMMQEDRDIIDAEWLEAPA